LMTRSVVMHKAPCAKITATDDSILMLTQNLTEIRSSETPFFDKLPREATLITLIVFY
jgi:hypothetical protein